MYKLCINKILELIKQRVQDDASVVESIANNKLIYAAAHCEPDYLRDESFQKLYEFQQSKRKQVEPVFKELFSHSNEKEFQYAVIKGASFEKCIYGNDKLRDVGDIDLLVNPCDLQLMHSILLEMGYTQNIGPSNTSSTKDGRAYAAICALNTKKKIERSTKPLRRHPKKHELAAYIKSGCPTIEVHDGFYNLPQPYINDVINRACKNEYNLLLDVADCLIFLLVNTYLNSESFFANLYGNEIVLRDYFDLYSFFKKYKHSIDEDELVNLIQQLRLEYIAGVVLHDFDCVRNSFDADNILAEIARCEGRFGEDIITRTFDAKLSSHLAREVFTKEAVKQSKRNTIVVESESESSFALKDDALASFSFTHNKKSKNVVAEILLPKKFANDEYLAQLCFYPFDESEPFCYKLIVSSFDGEAKSYIHATKRFLVDAEIKKEAGKKIKTECCWQENSVSIKVDLPNNISDLLANEQLIVSLGIFKRNHFDMFWRIDAGDEPLFDDVSAGRLFQVKNNFIKFDIEFSKFLCHIVSNDKQLVSSFKSVFLEHESSIQLYENDKRGVEYQVILEDYERYNILKDGSLLEDGLHKSEAAGFIMQEVSDSFCSQIDNSTIVMHAVCVSYNKKAILFIGRSGSGKTSLGVAFSKHGVLVGDECTFVDIKKGAAWCEDFPVQIKAKNVDILKHFDLKKSLPIKTRINEDAYYLCKGAMNYLKTPEDRIEIAAIVFPKYVEDCCDISIKSIEGKYFAEELLSSVISVKSPSGILKDIVNMISSNKIKVAQLEYYDVEKAAECIRDWIECVE